MKEKRYPSDLSSVEWNRLARLVPGPKPGGRPCKYERRAILNAILYLVRAGCTWRMMPLDMPPWRVVYHYFHQWTKSGWWRRDPALKVVCGRRPHSDADLASQPTISRFENRIRRRELLECAKVLARLAVAQVPARSRQIIIEVDSTDDPCHGQQELEGFNAYYDAHCYLPLLVHIIGEDGRRWQVASVLRPGRSHASCGFEAVLKRVLALVRERFPQAHCIIRPKPTTQYD